MKVNFNASLVETFISAIKTLHDKRNNMFVALVPRPVNIMSKISTFAIKSYSYDKSSSPVERPYAPDT